MFDAVPCIALDLQRIELLTKQIEYPIKEFDVQLIIRWLEARLGIWGSLSSLSVHYSLEDTMSTDETLTTDEEVHQHLPVHNVSGKPVTQLKPLPMVGGYPLFGKVEASLQLQGYRSMLGRGPQ